MTCIEAFKVLFQQVEQIHRMIPCYATHGSRQLINNKSIQENIKSGSLLQRHMAMQFSPDHIKVQR